MNRPKPRKPRKRDEYMFGPEAGGFMDQQQWRIEALESDNNQLRTERDSWKGMYMLCNEREQELLKIKELAEKFTQAYDDSHCWIENGIEEVSIYFDDLTAALTQREGGMNE